MIKTSVSDQSAATEEEKRILAKEQVRIISEITEDLDTRAAVCTFLNPSKVFELTKTNVVFRLETVVKVVYMERYVYKNQVFVAMNSILTLLSSPAITSKFLLTLQVVKLFMLNKHLLKDLEHVNVQVNKTLVRFSTDSKMPAECAETLTTYLRCVTDGHCARIGKYEFCSNPVSAGRLLCDECTLLSSIPSNPLDVSKIIADYTGF